jgi:hypothetical protein
MSPVVFSGVDDPYDEVDEVYEGYAELNVCAAVGK